MNVEDFKKRAVRALVRDKYFYLPVESAPIVPTVRFVACWRAIPFYTGVDFVRRRNDGIFGGGELNYGKTRSCVKETFTPKNMVAFRIYVDGAYAGAISTIFGMTFAQSIRKSYTDTAVDNGSYTQILDSIAYGYPSSHTGMDVSVDWTGSVTYDRSIDPTAVYGINDSVVTTYTDLPYGMGNYHTISDSFSTSEEQTFTGATFTRVVFNKRTGIVTSYLSASYHYEFYGYQAVSGSVEDPDTGVIYTVYRLGSPVSKIYDGTGGMPNQTFRPGLIANYKLWNSNFMNDADLITEQQFIDGQYTITRDNYDNRGRTSGGIIQRNSQFYYYLFDGLTIERYLEIISYAQLSTTTVICEYEN